MNGITKTPGVCGGRACIAGTRMAVWHIASVVGDGGTIAALEYWPHLTADQVAAAIMYAEEHPDEIADDVAENRGQERW